MKYLVVLQEVDHFGDCLDEYTRYFNDEKTAEKYCRKLNKMLIEEYGTDNFLVIGECYRIARIKKGE